MSSRSKASEAVKRAKQARVMKSFMLMVCRALVEIRWMGEEQDGARDGRRREKLDGLLY